MSNPIVIEPRKKGRPPIPDNLKPAKEIKPRGRPCKYKTEEDKKMAKKEYINNYYKNNSDRICENKRKLYVEHVELHQQLLDQNNQLLKNVKTEELKRI